MRQKLTKTQKIILILISMVKIIKLHFVHEQDICITAVHVYTKDKNTLLALHRCTVIPFSFINNNNLRVHFPSSDH